MSMNRPDYQSSYLRFRAFVQCAGRLATHSVDEYHVSPTPTDQPCYTQNGANLALCASCLRFWRECIKHDDQTTWQLAVYLCDAKGTSEMRSR